MSGQPRIGQKLILLFLSVLLTVHMFLGFLFLKFLTANSYGHTELKSVEICLDIMIHF